VIDESYASVQRRLQAVRGFVRTIVENENANRCAAVVGNSLHLYPVGSQPTFADSPDLKVEFKGHGFVHKYFLKAGDLAHSIRMRYGEPDHTSLGPSNADAKAWPPGVIYLEHCWPTGREKLKNLANNLGHLRGFSFYGDDQSGDHIDLWDGHSLEIERNEPGHGFALVLLAHRIHFWKLQSDR
jgi:hypothetical protein